MKRKLFLSLLISAGTHAAIRKPVDEVARSRSQVLQMGARLSSLEKEIGSKNDLYLSSIEQIKQFDGDVKLYRTRLVDIQKQVKLSQVENHKILKSYVLESENDNTEAWQRKVHFELLKQAQVKLKASEEELASFEAKVTEFDQKLAALKKDEEELALVIKELESRKKVAMEQYMTQVQTKKVAEKKVESKRIQAKVAEVKKQFSQAPLILSKPDRMFGKPVDDFLAYTASPKGVTFRYQAIQPVKAVGGGKIVFAGDLSNYGQVVLIDHGNDLRTVLLGKMNIKVKKNDTVSSGDILAYTLNDTKDPQNLYFEVRKKNTAQNTILWLDSNGISKI
ncbi:MAG TPA: peptidoglycan DD-metalloendopeptidase family protein [Bacteriovoracaceae bacterium]|nr:peptidoglycan DD-metalloendopeptidase family protein [Bacteriovoracaceae bacterium]